MRNPCPTSVSVAFAAFLAIPAAAQGGAGSPSSVPARQVVAVRVIARPPELDGRLTDPVWNTAQPATDFVLREPIEGTPALDRTEVRFVYTETALYIGARLHSTAPDAVRALVARRDREIPTEQLIVSLDTRADRRTAYTFAISPGGVRVDYFHPADFENARDYSFDPVWEARTAVDSLGWTAEIRIPFTQLRFNPGSAQRWGVNLMRRVPARNEQAFWVLVRRNETGWSSRMGVLEGIRDIPPNRRLEVVPYVATNARRVGGQIDPADPFAERVDATVRAGGDVKMGLGPNLTLDATFNPDFGQVEADPAEVNLTTYETFFAERRPFFIEGADLLGGRGTFYSRRIGARPADLVDAPYAESRDNTTILGAAKVTGRLPSGLSLGALGAVTAQEDVRTFDPTTNRFGRAVVAPLTGYGIVTGRQEFGRDRSVASGTLTMVERDLDPGSALAGLVARRAVSGVADTRLRWAGGKYDVSAYLGFSHLSGDSLAILRQQVSSRRYYQRPDADYVELDPSHTSLTGITAGINHSKLAGNWLWDIDFALESPGLELNDLGALGAADDRGLFADIVYRETRPGPLFHNWRLGVYEATEWNFGGVRNFTELGLSGGVTFKNFWEADFDLEFRPRSLSDNLTRGGPLMRTPLEWELSLNLNGRPGAQTRWSIIGAGNRNELGGRLAFVSATLALRPGTRWEVSFAPRYTWQVVPRQYVASRGDGPTATYGGRYIFGRIERSEVVTPVRLSYAITPNLTLETYVEPFASSGRYREFGELAAPRSFSLRTYGTDGTAIQRTDEETYSVTDGATVFTFGVPDFDVRSLRSNMVLRWEWRPGSTLFLVWQQNRFERSLPSGNVGPGALWDAFGAPGDHFLALKVSYWLALR